MLGVTEQEHPASAGKALPGCLKSPKTQKSSIFAWKKKGTRTRPRISKMLKDVVVPGRKSVQLQYLLWFNLSLNYKMRLDECSHPGSAERG